MAEERQLHPLSLLQHAPGNISLEICHALSIVEDQWPADPLQVFEMCSSYTRLLLYDHSEVFPCRHVLFEVITILRCSFVLAGMSSLRCKSNLRTLWIRTDRDCRRTPVCLRTHSAARTVLLDRASTPQRGLSTQQMRRSMPHHHCSQWVSMTLYGCKAPLQLFRVWYGVVRQMHLGKFFLPAVLTVSGKHCCVFCYSSGWQGPVNGEHHAHA